MILEKLQAASFRGFQFLVPTNSTTDGRKTVTHEFVNSDNRFVEDVGRFQPKFRVTAIVHGADAIQLRDSLRSELNKPGIGILIHPSYGRQEVVVEGQYSISDADTELGEYRFEITFVRSSGAAFPRAAQPTTSSVAASEQTARSQILQRIEDQWHVPLTTFSNVDAAAKLIAYADGIKLAFSPVVEDASEITRVVDAVTSNAASIVRLGSSVSSSMGGILGALDAIPTETLSTLNAITGFLDFGANDSTIVNSAGLSVDQSQRQLNRGLLNSAVQATSLTKAYTTSTLVDFEVVSRLDNTRSDLSASSRTILSGIRQTGIEFNAASASGVSTGATRARDAVNAILDTQTLSESVLSEKEQNLYRLSDVRQNVTSARLLSYGLFEDDDQTQIIADLNKAQRPSSLTGDLAAINR